MNSRPRANRSRRVAFPTKRSRAVLCEAVVAALVGYLASLVTGTGPSLHQPLPGGPAVDVAAFAGLGNLAFVSGEDLYVLDGTTQALRRVETGSGVTTAPQYSHDGQWLAFLSSRTSRPFADALWIAKGDGSDAHRVVGLSPLVGSAPASGAPEVAWSPTRDELLVTTAATVGPANEEAVWVVPVLGEPHEIVAGATFGGAIWSPDGRQVALTRWDASTGDSVLETVLRSGAQPTVWDDLYSGPYDPAAWSANYGILLWDDGGGGSAVDNDGVPLGYVPRPGAALSLLPAAPFLHPGAYAVGHGALAIVANVSGAASPASDDTAAAQRLTSFAKSVESCSARTDACTAVVTRPAVVTLNPAISPSTEALAFVEAPQSTLGVSDEQLRSSPPTETWAQLSPWYAAHSLWLLEPGSTRPTQVSGAGGASQPMWSPNGRSLMYVASSSLWLLPQPGARPVEIATSLAPDGEQNGSFLFGYVDWSSEFAWGSSRR